MGESRKRNNKKEAMRNQAAWRYVTLRETYDKFAHLKLVAPSLIRRLHIQNRQVFSEP